MRQEWIKSVISKSIQVRGKPVKKNARETSSFAKSKQPFSKTPVEVVLVANFSPLNVLMGISVALSLVIMDKGFKMQYGYDRDEDLTN